MRKFLLIFLGFFIAFSLFFGGLPNLDIVFAADHTVTQGENVDSGTYDTFTVPVGVTGTFSGPVRISAQNIYVYGTLDGNGRGSGGGSGGARGDGGGCHEDSPDWCSGRQPGTNGGSSSGVGGYGGGCPSHWGVSGQYYEPAPKGCGGPGDGGGGGPYNYSSDTSTTVQVGTGGGGGGGSNPGNIGHGWVGGGGGTGGGGIALIATNTFVIDGGGRIYANGTGGGGGGTGESCDSGGGGSGGGGGGSGGTITIQGATVNLTNGYAIQALGGSGGVGGPAGRNNNGDYQGTGGNGGTGNGGRIKVFYATLNGSSSSLSAGSVYSYQYCAAAVACPTTCHTDTQSVSNGSCGQTSCPANAPAAVACPTTCHADTQTVPNGQCGITSCPEPCLTTEYRCSEVKFNENDTSSPTNSTAPSWVPYQNEDFSGEPIKFNYTFTNNVTPGNDLTLFCQFKASNGTTSQVYQKSINYIGGNPKITNIACGYDPSGTGTQVTVKGLNFGNHAEEASGGVKLVDKDTTISYWANDGTSTDSAKLSYKIISKVQDKLVAGKYKVALTIDDGRTAWGFCTIGITTLDFKLKTNCVPSSGSLALSNVSASVTEKADKAKSVINKKISIDVDGKPGDFNPELEVGKTYIFTIRGPKTISKKVEFTTEEGTTALNDIILPVGDIYPVSSPDNAINSFDKGEMGREWNIINDVTRPADLNGDLRVNSVDYSCFLKNFNQSGN